MKFAGLFSLSVVAGVMLSGGAALADTKQDEAYKKAEAAAKSRIDTWAQEIDAAAKAGKPHEEVVKSMSASSQKVEDELKAATQTYDCKDPDQAKRVETYIHQKFHHFYKTISVQDGFTHGVNMSCSPKHKLQPTLWIKEYKPSPTLAAAEAKAGKAADAQHDKNDKLYEDLIQAWVEALHKALGNPDKTREEILSALNAENTTLAGQLRGKPCTDEAQAKRLQGWLDGRRTDFKTGIGGKPKVEFTGPTTLSCTAQKFVPTLSFSAYKVQIK